MSPFELLVGITGYALAFFLGVFVYTHISTLLTFCLYILAFLFVFVTVFVYSDIISEFAWKAFLKTIDRLRGKLGIMRTINAIYHSLCSCFAACMSSFHRFYAASPIVEVQEIVVAIPTPIPAAAIEIETSTSKVENTKTEEIKTSRMAKHAQNVFGCSWPELQIIVHKRCKERKLLTRIAEHEARIARAKLQIFEWQQKAAEREEELKAISAGGVHRSGTASP